MQKLFIVITEACWNVLGERLRIWTSQQ